MSQSAPLEPVEASAATLEEAIEKGLTALSLTRNDVIIEIVEEGTRGVLGLGARDAIVRLTPLRGPQTSPAPREAHHPHPATNDIPLPTEEEMEQEAETAREILGELLSHMQVKAHVDLKRAEQGFEDEEGQTMPWVLNIQGADLGVLIGRKGETLEALQYILRQLVSHQLQRRSTVIVDVEGYKARRESTLRSLAQRMAAQARQMGRTVTLEPMPPNERRIIHLALRDDKSVSTESIGEGERRKVTIIPNRTERR